MAKVNNKDLCSILLDADPTGKTADCSVVAQHLIEKYNLDNETSTLLLNRLNTYFMPAFKSKWRKCFYNLEKLFSSTKNQSWLSSDFDIQFPSRSENSAKRKKEFEFCSEKTQKRRSQELLQNLTNEEIEHAFFSMLTARGQNNVVQLIKDIISSQSQPETDILPPVSLSHDEAVAVIVDTDLTKAQYNLIRKKAKEKNADIFPHYVNITKAKMQCFPSPSAVTVTETCASIELQSLLDHTTERIMKIPDVTISKSIVDNIQKIVLVTKWGADGTSGFNEYKQKFTNSDDSDKYLFLLSMVPLRLKAVLCDFSEVIVWENPRTSSTNYCRPIKFKFVQETKETVLIELSAVNKEIEKLSCTEVDTNVGTISIQHELHCTMVDGKICQYATETSSSSVCPICSASPKEMNNLETIKLKPIKRNALEFGLSSLHKWIRFMECVLHIAYRLPFKKWAVHDTEHKVLFSDTKKRIQSKLRKELGLIVDVPKQGSGTSNDGNTARTFFRNYDVVSKITGVDEQLLKRMFILLQTMASGKLIDVTRFREYANTTAELYIKNYEWYYMPVGVHTVFCHGADIIDQFVLPIGYMSEEAQESRNKDFKRARTEHTRKTSRNATNEDLLRYLLVSSDPYIASLRKIPITKERKLLDEAIELLAEAERTAERQGEKCRQGE